jgi:predicted TIM-barrel fold metal-dependent hydrolase
LADLHARRKTRRADLFPSGLAGPPALTDSYLKEYVKDFPLVVRPTSGFFSDPALLCCVMEMGVDRILFAVDWPFVVDNKPAVQWLSRIPLSDEDKIKIASGNAKRLLRM